MCVIPESSKIASTKIRVGKTRDGQSKILAYQNEVEVVGTGKRVMLLPIPGEIIKIHNTSTYNSFLNETHEQCLQHLQDHVRSARAVSAGAAEVIVRETVGIYEVLYVNHPSLINKGLELFTEEERPGVGEDMIEFYKEMYPDWSIVLAVFDNQEKMSSQPFLIEYKGKIKVDEKLEAFHIPGLDNEKDGIHEGLPDINAWVSTEHFISMNVWPEQGFEERDDIASINYSQEVDQQLISDKVVYEISNEELKNGDWFFLSNGLRCVRDNQNLKRSLAELAS